MADNTLVYIQHATCGDPQRAAFDFDTHAGGLLEGDHRLMSKVAVFLNDTGGAVHEEPSFVMVYQWEKR